MRLHILLSMASWAASHGGYNSHPAHCSKHRRWPLGRMCAWRTQFRVVAQVLNVDEQRRIAEGALPLSPGATLKWLAVTDAHAPATKDSAGVFRSWAASFGGSWVPVLHEDACDGECAWPVGVAAGELHYVPCDAASGPEVRHNSYPRLDIEQPRE